MGNGPTKEEKLIEQVAIKETLLECPILVDLDHGTVRHRHEERDNNEEEEDKVKIGYFYHPRLNDFSEDALMTQSENNRLKYVFKGPLKDTGKKLYYIYGTKVSDKDEGIHHDQYKPQGKGYNWPQSYRKANNLYYDVIFPQKDDNGDTTDVQPEELDDTSSVSSGITADMLTQKDEIGLKLRHSETVGDVVERISLQLLIPSSNIHLMVNKKELKNNEVLADFIPDSMKRTTLFSVTLRLT